MNRYLILIEKVLNLKEYIEKLILEGKRKGYDNMTDLINSLERE